MARLCTNARALMHPRREHARCEADNCTNSVGTLQMRDFHDRGLQLHSPAPPLARLPILNLASRNPSEVAACAGRSAPNKSAFSKHKPTHKGSLNLTRGAEQSTHQRSPCCASRTPRSHKTHHINQIRTASNTGLCLQHTLKSS
eukprot:CAMPEP_0170351430 /NCGR_PEP_ID=MMETSP0116_2-20130129/77016_1 /TAXON_ID=400756 /ORGANISM="Durinskia baltica, Strain CSIRO CS-38" /LENGTH=143 /DNA_ID=CAMNT_0010605335 /DNA_START=39 /DNA_END=466 /DNA_ORIENTATION=+